MTTAKLSKWPLAVAACAILTLAGLPALAAPSPTDLTLTFGADSSGTQTTSTTKSLNPGASVVWDTTVTRPTAVQDRPMTLTLTYAFPADSEFVSLTGCTRTSTTSSPVTCTISDPFPPSESTAGVESWGTKIKTKLTVKRHYDSHDAIPTACPTGNIGTVTATVTSDATDPNPADNTASGTLTYKPWAHLVVTGSAPASASAGATIAVTGKLTNLGPCTAPNVVVYPEVWDGTSMPDGSLRSNLTFKAGTDALVGMTAAEDDYNSSSNGHAVGDMTAGQILTLGKQYTVDTLSLDMTLSQTIRYSGFSVGSDINDPDTSTNTADTSTAVPQSTGCASAGEIGPLAVLAFAFARTLRRRRNA
jgi:hypothetical protein